MEVLDAILREDSELAKHFDAHGITDALLYDTNRLRGASAVDLLLEKAGVSKLGMRAAILNALAESASAPAPAPTPAPAHEATTSTHAAELSRQPV